MGSYKLKKTGKEIDDLLDKLDSSSIYKTTLFFSSIERREDKSMTEEEWLEVNNIIAKYKAGYVVTIADDRDYPFRYGVINVTMMDDAVPVTLSVFNDQGDLMAYSVDGLSPGNLWIITNKTQESGGGGSSNNSLAYDYVINSVVSLMSLSGNSTARNVLIKKAVYRVDLSKYSINSNKFYIELLDNIESVTAEPGAVIKIYGDHKLGGDIIFFGRKIGFRQTNFNKSYNISNLKIYLDVTQFMDTSTECSFHLLYGLKMINNCEIYLGGTTLKAEGGTHPAYWGTIFSYCTFISNCTINGLEVRNEEYDVNAYGANNDLLFNQCSFISDIYLYGNSSKTICSLCSHVNNMKVEWSYDYLFTDNSIMRGIFISSNIISNVSFTETIKRLKGTGNGYSGFKNCSNITNCYFKLLTGSFHFIQNFYNGCKYLTNCNAVLYVDYYDFENRASTFFYFCSEIVNCSAEKSSIPSELNDLYDGFVQCLSVGFCKAINFKSDNAYKRSYSAGTDSSSTYLCADTPNGGFNKTVLN